MNQKLIRSIGGLLCVVAAACTEPTAPEAARLAVPANPVNTASATCHVDVRKSTITCDDLTTSLSSSGSRATVMLGGQDVFLRISSSGTAYDSATSDFHSTVTVQNLTKQSIGTDDGVAVKGVNVFFNSGPTVTSGTGTVTVNADGTAMFSQAGQPYYLYNQILAPYEISSSRLWQFTVPATVKTFDFTLLVSTSAVNEAGSYLDKVWNGSVSSVWENASNWNSGVPDSASTVAVPPASLLGSGQQPVLSGGATILNLRVGTASSLNLSGFSLRVRGNLDAPGSITNGLAVMTGSSAVAGGTVDRLDIQGKVRLQRDLKTTGRVSINDGLLNSSDKLIYISIQ